jgi:hypothetical protein
MQAVCHGWVISSSLYQEAFYDDSIQGMVNRTGIDINTKCVVYVHFLYGLLHEQLGNGRWWSRSGTRSVWIGVRPIAEAQFGNGEDRRDAPGDRGLCPQQKTTSYQDKPV